MWLSSGHERPPESPSAPIVAMAHEGARVPPEHEPYVPRQIVEVIAALTDSGLAAATLIIVPSNASRADVAQHHAVDPSIIRVVAHGVDSARFAPRRGDEADPLIRHLGLEAPYIVFAARPYPRKNLASLRRAVAGLASEGFPHHLVVAGGPIDEWGLHGTARQVDAELENAPGRVHWLKQLDDAALSAILAHADAFCLPSFFEGFGLTALEAMACGIPVVVSNAGALPEVVGDAGLVVEPRPEAVQQALRTVLTDPPFARALGRSARERALEFSWDKTADGWHGVLVEAAEMA